MPTNINVSVGTSTPVSVSLRETGPQGPQGIQGEQGAPGEGGGSSSDPFQRRKIPTGYFYTNGLLAGSSTTSTQVANHISLSPFLSPQAMVIDQISFHNATVKLNDELYRLVIYAGHETEMRPTTLLYDSETSRSAAGTLWAEEAVELTLSLGQMIWLGIAASGANVMRGQGGPSLGVLSTSSSSFSSIRAVRIANTYADPAPATIASGDLIYGGTPVLFNLRVASYT